MAEVAEVAEAAQAFAKGSELRALLFEWGGQPEAAAKAELVEDWGAFVQLSRKTTKRRPSWAKTPPSEAHSGC